MASKINEALDELHSATGKDAHEHALGALAEAARACPQGVVGQYFSSGSDTFALVWCLQGIIAPTILPVLHDARLHKSANVRWAAFESLKHFADPQLMPVFIAALKDRSGLVKSVALEWLHTNGDSTAIVPLRRLTELG